MSNVTLYKHQIKLIDNARNILASGKKSVCNVSPTGSGKTLCFGYITQKAVEKNNNVLILTHRQEIMKQTIEKFYDKFGIICSQIASGKPLTRGSVQVAMVQTIVNRLNALKFNPNLIIIDECHHGISPTWQKVLHHFGEVPRLGFTATPERLSGEGLCDIFDSINIGASISELVAEGVLSYPRIFRPPHEIEENYRLVRGDFDKEQQNEVMTKKIIVGDVIEHYRKYLNGYPAACFCISHKHMDYMYNVFNDANIKAVKVYSGMLDSDREKALKGIADGTYNVILSVDILGEGVDVPGLHGVIMLRKTASLGLYLQQAGRALRLADGKECAYILDHCGNVKLHGHVLADRDWSLDHGKRNIKKDKPLETTSCPRCFAVWAGKPKKCFDCGFVFSDIKDISDQQRKTPQVIAGELKEILPEGFEGFNELFNFAQKAQAMDAKQRGKTALALAYKYKDKNAIEAMRKVIGYKKGWTKIAWDLINKH